MRAVTLAILVAIANLLAGIVGVARAEQKSDADPAAGRVLLGELNCTACHAPTPAQAAWLTPKVAPRLNDIGSRVSPDWVAAYLATPHESTPGVTMPDLLGHLPPAEQSAAAEALTHHLFATSPPRSKRAFPDRAAVRRGEALYRKVGCVACHALQDAKPVGGSVPLPDMSRKWAFDGLRRFVRDPLAFRPSGRMPSLNLTDAEAADVAHYLLRDTKVPAAVEVTQFRGQIRSFDDLDSAEPSRTFPASALTLDAMGRDRGYAIRFSTFLRVEKAGDHTFHLATAGAARLAVDGKWLVGQDSWRRERVDGRAKVTLDVGLHAVTLDFVARGQKESSLKVEWEGPGVPREAFPAARLQASREPVAEPPVFVVDPAKAAKGKALYAELNCAACHENNPAKASTSLAALHPTRGCLSDAPPATVPNFRLDAKSTVAVRSAIASLKPADVPPPSPQQRLGHALTSFRCTACHARDGVGGPSADRDAYFTSAGEDLGDEGRVPPRLDGVGDKLRPDALAAVLTKAAAVRPYLNVRMPQYGEANVGHLPAVFVALDRKPTPVKPSPDPADVQREVGRTLVGTDGLSCIACHKFNRQPAQAMQVIDLTTAPERLNEDWFGRFLVDPNKYHPNTRMPAFWPGGRSLLPKVLDGSTDRQVSAVWTYLGDGPRAKFPQGLSRQNVELVVGGEAVVYRGKLWEAGYRGIATGYPGGLNAAFDAEECRLSLLWRGRFLNAGPHWTVQGMGQIRPLGTDVVVFPRGSPLAVLAEPTTAWPTATPRELGMKFGGYQLDSAGRPTLLYSFAGKRVEDAAVPIDGPKPGLRRAIAFVDGPPENLYLRLAVGKLAPAGDRAWRLNDAMTIVAKGGGGAAIVRGVGDQQELLVPIAGDEKGRRVEVDYVW